MFDLKCINCHFFILKDCFFHINNSHCFTSSRDKASGRIWNDLPQSAIDVLTVNVQPIYFKAEFEILLGGYTSPEE